MLHAKSNNSSVTLFIHCFIAQSITSVSVVYVMVDIVGVVELYSFRLACVVLFYCC